MTEPIEDHELAAGQVQWHSSEEDGGPDVGIMIGLGDGVTLWFGELLNSEGRFGFTVFSPTEKLAVASYDEYDEVRELLEQHVAPALRRPSPVAESTPTDATAVEAERLTEAQRRKIVDQIVPDLNNIARAIEDEGDRAYFGSSNDADELRSIADQMETIFRRTPKES